MHAPAPKPRAPARLSPGLAVLAALAGMAALAACDRAQEDPLAPLARMARSGMGTAEERVARAHAFLAGDVAPHVQIQSLFAQEGPGDPPQDVERITWPGTPYIAVGVFDADGKLLGALPHAGEGVEELLGRVVQGPEVGDLTRIPNTFAFTVGMRQPVPGHDGARIAALLAVDQVLVADVLQPLAEAAHGFAFLADGEGNAVLTTLPALTGRALAHFQIPLPDPGQEATATVTIDGHRYDVAAARSAGLHGWIVGVGVAALEPGPGA